MAKDYKYRAQGRSSRHQDNTANPLRSVGFWKWMLITALIIAFVVSLVYVQGTGSKSINATQSLSGLSTIKALKSASTAKQGVAAESGQEQKFPRFDFYNILPNKEVVVPDHEINTRTREEHLGKGKTTQYMMQAGSFKTFKEADQQRAKLGLLGIESKVLKGKVGNVIWYRVKVGPYAKMTSISAIKSRLRQNGIDVIVTESGE